jgi:acyl-CoA thioesterase FadM
LVETNQITFAVTKLQVDFVAAAFIDDPLEVVTELQPARGPVLTFRQTVVREGGVIAKGEVDIVAIRGNRAVRPPREIVMALAQRTPLIP